MAMDPKELRDRAAKALQADYFALLGVPRGAGPEMIEQAYVNAARVLHPDRGTEELRPLLTKAFARLDQARTTLIDPGLRQRYLQELTRPASAEQLAGAEAALEYKKGEAFLKKNDHAQAEIHLKRAVGLVPEHVDYRTLLAFAQATPNASLQRVRELVADLDKVLKDKDTHERAHFYRGLLKRRLGSEPDALRDFGRAAELNPNNIDAAREVRIHKMRTATAMSSADDKPGFFAKLFKR